MMKKILTIVLFGLIAVFIPFSADAATFGLSAGGQSFSVGDTITVDLRVDSEGVSVNAAQGTVRFSPDVLEVASVDRSQTVFNFWLQEPAIDNSAGTVSWTGGSTSGFSGGSLEVFKINFRVKGVGSSSISVSDGAVTASDGSGTNVLVGTRGIDISAGGVAGLPNEEITVLPLPEQITRPAAPASAVPEAPDVSIGLYSNQEAWQNVSAPFLASWDLTSDISAVATAVNKNPSFNPVTSEGLFNNKTFAALEDGIWYLHVRFRNSAGWGSTAHYRLAIDTAPPVPFSVVYSSGNSSTNPSPTATFDSSDSLSGIGKYSVQINNGNYLPAEGNSIVIPTMGPGNHAVRVVAEDNAGNSTETISALEVIPIETPAITFVTASVYTGEGGFEIRGTSIPGYSVTVSLKDANGTQVASGTSQTDQNGSWFVKLDEPLKRGRYYAEAAAKDSRGASSLSARSEEIRTYSKPIITIAGVGVTATALLIAVIVAMIAVFFIGRLAERKMNNRRQSRIIIAKRDITNVLDLIKKDITSAGSTLDKSAEKEAGQAKYLLEKAGKNIDKMGRYLVEGVEEINSRKKR